MPPTGCCAYVCVHVRMYVRIVRYAVRSRGPKSPARVGEGTNMHPLGTYDFRGDVAAWKKIFSRLLVRPIPMRKANPAFCDRSKSHKKLDPFDDRKMVHWLAENPFLVRSSTMSVRVPMTVPHVCVCVRVCVWCERARAIGAVRRQRASARVRDSRLQLHRRAYPRTTRDCITDVRIDVRGSDWCAS